MKQESIKIGDKVDLRLDRGPYFRTVVDDIGYDNMLLLPIPTYKGIPIILRIDQSLQLYYYRENGSYRVNARVIDFDLKSTVKMVQLQVTSDPERMQRRESFRVTTTLRANLRPYYLGPFPENADPSLDYESESVSTFNISSTGVAVRSKGDYSVGDHVFMRIFLAWPKQESPPLYILGEVKQATKIDSINGISHLGILFLDISPEMASHIAKFVLIVDQRHAMQRRIVEE